MNWCVIGHNGQLSRLNLDNQIPAICKWLSYIRIKSTRILIKQKWSTFIISKNIKEHRCINFINFFEILIYPFFLQNIYGCHDSTITTSILIPFITKSNNIVFKREIVNVGPVLSPREGPTNLILAEGKHTRYDIVVRVFHAAVSVADFHNTITSKVRPANRSWYNFENHRSTPGPKGGLRKTRPTQG